MTERQLLIDTVAEVLAEQASIEADGANGGWPSAVWTTLEGIGFSRLGVGEDLGGSGGELADAVAAVRTAARSGASLPLAETLLATWAFAAAGLPLPSGPSTLALANGSVGLVREQGRMTARGVVPRVPWARHAERLAIVDDRAAVVAAIEIANCRIVERVNLAGEARDDVVVDMTLAAEDVRALPTGWGERDAMRLGALLRAAQIAGALERVLELTLRHVQLREQFGQPLIAFQAVQHGLAALAGAVSATVVAVETAAETPAGDLADIAVAAAKSYASRGCGVGAAISHQLHGAIGFTEEYELQLHTRRLWSWRDEFGSEMYWASRLGSRMSADEAWSLISAAPELTDA